MDDLSIHRLGCLDSARCWRREAAALRGLADNAALAQGQRHTLLSEADAADYQAEAWLDAVINAGRRQVIVGVRPDGNIGQ
jgi:hypothetical protein